MSYHLYPCTNSEELFQAVLQNGTDIGLHVNFGQNLFQPKPLLLFQNNALGEWFKVHLAQQKGISIGITINHSKEVLEHYLSLFFPERQEPNWVRADIISLRIFQWLRNCPEPEQYLPKALRRQETHLISNREIFELHLWGLAQKMGELFLHYDQYRKELQKSLHITNSEAYSGDMELKNPPKAEKWQQNLWHQVGQWTDLDWHGKQIEKIINQKLCPRDSIEPLYIIGSGFLNAQQLNFYHYLSQFIPVKHFWLTPTLFPLKLRQDLGQILWGSESQDPMAHRQSYEHFYNNLDKHPQTLWLENSLHSAALLSHISQIEWQANVPMVPRKPKLLLQLIQQKLRHCYDPTPTPNIETGPNIILDPSISYFACANRRREVEVLKEQIVANLDANPDWQLNDIAILAPDINQYQSLIHSIFQKEGLPLTCNFIDLSISNTSNKADGTSILSEYFSAFVMLLNFNHFALDECLAFLENSCVRTSKLLRTKSDDFWLKVFKQWQLNYSKTIKEQYNIQAINHSKTNLNGAWQNALKKFIYDYLHDYETNSSLAQQISFHQDEAELLAEVLEILLYLPERLQPLYNQNYTISEWVQQLENLQDEFLTCHNQHHQRDKDILNISLRNFLAIEESLNRKQYKKQLEYLPNFPFHIIRDLLQKKLEQNFSFKGRYLTQGITCATLQPYRSVPFRMICVLGLNEKAFPHSPPALPFDLCPILPQYLSKEAQSRHIFTELLISAKERLLLFYQNYDMVKGTIRNPSTSMQELCYFIAQILQQDEENIWQQLTQVHPLFPFDSEYFCSSTNFFSYNRHHYQQYLSLQNSYQQPVKKIIISECNHSKTLPKCNFRDLLNVLSNAPKYYFQQYYNESSKSERITQNQSTLPLLEKLNQGTKLSISKLEPLKYNKWQQQLWNEAEYLLTILRVYSSTDALEQLLQAEGAFNNALFKEEQLQSFQRGLNTLKRQLEQSSGWPGWDTFYRIRRYSLSLQDEQNPRSLFSTGSGLSQGILFFPALTFELQTNSTIKLDAHIPRLYFINGQKIFCWNKSPFGVGHKIYNLLQKKLFQNLFQLPSLEQQFGQVNELHQLEWTYNDGLSEKTVTNPIENSQIKLIDYLWLLSRAICEPLPITTDFLEFIKKKGEIEPQLQELKANLQQENIPILDETSILPNWPLAIKLQKSLREEWHNHIQQIEPQKIPFFLLQLPINFYSKTLQQPRYWLLLHDILSHI